MKIDWIEIKKFDYENSIGKEFLFKGGKLKLDASDFPVNSSSIVHARYVKTPTWCKEECFLVCNTCYYECLIINPTNFIEL